MFLHSLRSDRIFRRRMRSSRTGPVIKQEYSIKRQDGFLGLTSDERLAQDLYKTISWNVFSTFPFACTSCAELRVALPSWLRSQAKNTFHAI
ncbi:hypothetical protein LEP1GSC192_2702 [Leptospira sp. B5-022]|nr:hypothetical protein LEP1GSC192_2702 [Leptospira sp. B5-022]